MSYESPKQEPKNNDTQFHLFGTENDITNVLKTIDEKYPYAKINPSIVTGDAVNGFFVKGKTLEEYAEEQNRLYIPEENDIYHQN